ncbi:MAG: hypothetical protein ACREOU_01820 [Candidatus Eiseniibacteriota bacterium]
MNSSVPDATPAALPPASADAPFPLGSVQAVASLSWRMCLRSDPFGLLLIPAIVFFPVWSFVTLLGEIMVHLGIGMSSSNASPVAGQRGLLAAVMGVLPLVVFSRVLGESWILVRADALAHGRRLDLAETFSRALARSWSLIAVMVAVYALFQIGFFLLVLPGLVVAIACSFANQAAVLGPGRLFGSLRQSRDLLEHNVTAWLGMVAYWGVLFLGLGILVGIVRQSAVGVLGPSPGFLLDLALGLPLQLALLVFTTCWTLFYRELEARRHRHQQRSESASPVALEATTPPRVPDGTVPAN